MKKVGYRCISQNLCFINFSVFLQEKAKKLDTTVVTAAAAAAAAAVALLPCLALLYGVVGGNGLLCITQSLQRQAQLQRIDLINHAHADISFNIAQMVSCTQFDEFRCSPDTNVAFQAKIADACDNT